MAAGDVWTVLLALVLCVLPASAQLTELADTQLQALVQIYTALGSSSTSLRWNASSSDYCSTFVGVFCCAEFPAYLGSTCNSNRSVAALRLSRSGLVGALPDAPWGSLVDLQELDLSGNTGLTGSLPRSLGSLPKLWVLDACETQLANTAQAGTSALPSYITTLVNSTAPAGADLQCLRLGFAQPRPYDTQLRRYYSSGGGPRLYLEPAYYGYQGCGCVGSGRGLVVLPAQGASLPTYSCTPPSALQDSNRQGLVIGLAVASAVAGTALLALFIVAARGLAKRRQQLSRVREYKVMAGLSELDPSQMDTAAGLGIGMLPKINRNASWKRSYPPGMVINDAGDVDGGLLREVTLVITDVEGSTELWEWNEAVMTEAQELHDQIMRSLISRYCGHEVTTEGDSFIVAFHEAIDAVAWALHLQFAMLSAPWPALLLADERCAPTYASEDNCSRSGQLLFRGLRIRVGLSTGIPARMQRHEVTHELQYFGQVMDMTAAISELPAGGQVLVGPTSLARISTRLLELGALLPTVFWNHRRSMVQQTGGMISSSVYGIRPLNHEGDEEVGLQTARMGSFAFVQRAASSVSLALHGFRRLAQRRGPATTGGLAADADAEASSRQAMHALSLRGHSSEMRGLPINGVSMVNDFLVGGTIAPLPVSTMISTLGSVRGRKSGSASSWGLMSFGLGANSVVETSHTSSSYKQPPGQLDRASIAGLSQPDEHAEDVPLVLDMGTHWLEGIVPAPVENMPPQLVGTRLTQVISKCLAGRTMTFPPLPTARQVSASYFDAPYASSSLLPEGLSFKGIPQGSYPEVCIVFSAPAQLKPLAAANAALAKEALAAFCGCVRLTLYACRGYECQEKDGIFMIAFSDVAGAIEWACVLQLGLLRTHWPAELLGTPIGAEVVDTNGELLFRGLRARVGIYSGSITRIIPHRTTGRADFFGPPVNRAARFLAACAPGQILAEQAAVESVMAVWKSREAAMLAVMHEAEAAWVSAAVPSGSQLVSESQMSGLGPEYVNLPPGAAARQRRRLSMAPSMAAFAQGGGGSGCNSGTLAISKKGSSSNLYSYVGNTGSGPGAAYDPTAVHAAFIGGTSQNSLMGSSMPQGGAMRFALGSSSQSGFLIREGSLNQRKGGPHSAVGSVSQGNLDMVSALRPPSIGSGTLGSTPSRLPGSRGSQSQGRLAAPSPAEEGSSGNTPGLAQRLRSTPSLTPAGAIGASPHGFSPLGVASSIHSHSQSHVQASGRSSQHARARSMSQAHMEQMRLSGSHNSLGEAGNSSFDNAGVQEFVGSLHGSSKGRPSGLKTGMGSSSGSHEKGLKGRLSAIVAKGLRSVGSGSTSTFAGSASISEANHSYAGQSGGGSSVGRRLSMLKQLRNSLVSFGGARRPSVVSASNNTQPFQKPSNTSSIHSRSPSHSYANMQLMAGLSSFDPTPYSRSNSGTGVAMRSASRSNHGANGDLRRIASLVDRTSSFGNRRRNGILLQPGMAAASSASPPSPSTHSPGETNWGHLASPTELAQHASLHTSQGIMHSGLSGTSMASVLGITGGLQQAQSVPLPQLSSPQALASAPASAWPVTVSERTGSATALLSRARSRRSALHSPLNASVIQEEDPQGSMQPQHGCLPGQGPGPEWPLGGAFALQEGFRSSALSSTPPTARAALLLPQVPGRQAQPGGSQSLREGVSARMATAVRLRSRHNTNITPNYIAPFSRAAVAGTLHAPLPMATASHAQDAAQATTPVPPGRSSTSTKQVLTDTVQSEVDRVSSSRPSSVSPAVSRQASGSKLLSRRAISEKRLASMFQSLGLLDRDRRAADPAQAARRRSACEPSRLQPADFVVQRRPASTTTLTRTCLSEDAFQGQCRPSLTAVRRVAPTSQTDTMTPTETPHESSTTTLHLAHNMSHLADTMTTTSLPAASLLLPGLETPAVLAALGIAFSSHASAGRASLVGKGSNSGHVAVGDSSSTVMAGQPLMQPTPSALTMPQPPSVNVPQVHPTQSGVSMRRKAALAAANASASGLARQNCGPIRAALQVHQEASHSNPSPNFDMHTFLHDSGTISQELIDSGASDNNSTKILLDALFNKTGLSVIEEGSSQSLCFAEMGADGARPAAAASAVPTYGIGFTDGSTGRRTWPAPVIQTTQNAPAATAAGLPSGQASRFAPANLMQQSIHLVGDVEAGAPPAQPAPRQASDPMAGMLLQVPLLVLESVGASTAATCCSSMAGTDAGRGASRHRDDQAAMQQAAPEGHGPSELAEPHAHVQNATGLSPMQPAALLHAASVSSTRKTDPDAHQATSLSGGGHHLDVPSYTTSSVASSMQGAANDPGVTGRVSAQPHTSIRARTPGRLPGAAEIASSTVPRLDPDQLVSQPLLHEVVASATANATSSLIDCNCPAHAQGAHNDLMLGTADHTDTPAHAGQAGVGVFGSGLVLMDGSGSLTGRSFALQSQVLPPQPAVLTRASAAAMLMLVPEGSAAPSGTSSTNRRHVASSADIPVEWGLIQVRQAAPSSTQREGTGSGQSTRSRLSQDWQANLAPSLGSPQVSLLHDSPSPHARNSEAASISLANLAGFGTNSVGTSSQAPSSQMESQSLRFVGSFNLPNVNMPGSSAGMSYAMSLGLGKTVVGRSAGTIGLGHGGTAAGHSPGYVNTFGAPGTSSRGRGAHGAITERRARQLRHWEVVLGSEAKEHVSMSSSVIDFADLQAALDSTNGQENSTVSRFAPKRAPTVPQTPPCYALAQQAAAPSSHAAPAQRLSMPTGDGPSPMNTPQLQQQRLSLESCSNHAAMNLTSQTAGVGGQTVAAGSSPTPTVQCSSATSVLTTGDPFHEGGSNIATHRQSFGLSQSQLQTLSATNDAPSSQLPSALSSAGLLETGTWAPAVSVPRTGLQRLGSSQGPLLGSTAGLTSSLSADSAGGVAVLVGAAGLPTAQASTRRTSVVGPSEMFVNFAEAVREDENESDDDSEAPVVNTMHMSFQTGLSGHTALSRTHTPHGLLPSPYQSSQHASIPFSTCQLTNPIPQRIEISEAFAKSSIASEGIGLGSAYVSRVGAPTPYMIGSFTSLRSGNASQATRPSAVLVLPSGPSCSGSVTYGSHPGGLHGTGSHRGRQAQAGPGSGAVPLNGSRRPSLDGSGNVNYNHNQGASAFAGRGSGSGGGGRMTGGGPRRPGPRKPASLKHMHSSGLVGSGAAPTVGVIGNSALASQSPHGGPATEMESTSSIGHVAGSGLAGYGASAGGSQGTSTGPNKPGTQPHSRALEDVHMHTMPLGGVDLLPPGVAGTGAGPASSQQGRSNLNLRQPALARRRFERVPVQVQVHFCGTWSFKGIAKPYPVVQIIPSCLAGRLPYMVLKSGAKAQCVTFTEGLLGSVCVDMVSLSQIMHNPNDPDLLRNDE